MNAGPVASHRGSAFRVFVFTAGDEHAITLAAPHHVWDALSAVALMRELLEQLARPRALPPFTLRAVDSPFRAPCSAEQRARLADLAREAAAWPESEPPTRRDRRADLCCRRTACSRSPCWSRPSATGPTSATTTSCRRSPRLDACAGRHGTHDPGTGGGRPRPDSRGGGRVTVKVRYRVRQSEDGLLPAVMPKLAKRTVSSSARSWGLLPR
jgi:hypothetical protein